MDKKYLSWLGSFAVGVLLAVVVMSAFQRQRYDFHVLGAPEGTKVIYIFDRSTGVCRGYNSVGVWTCYPDGNQTFDLRINPEIGEQ
jgi:hypothetical protein